MKTYEEMKNTIADDLLMQTAFVLENTVKEIVCLNSNICKNGDYKYNISFENKNDMISCFLMEITGIKVELNLDEDEELIDMIRKKCFDEKMKIINACEEILRTKYDIDINMFKYYRDYMIYNDCIHFKHVKDLKELKDPNKENKIESEDMKNEN